MTANQVVHGFLGGILGFAFSSPLVLHEGWMRMAKFREKNPTTRSIYYGATFLIFPILMLLGVLGSPLIGAYAAYQCYKESSLEPLIQTIKAPYQGNDPENRYDINISRGMLIGYSTVLTILSFTLINMAAGNVFGFLGMPGSAILSSMLPAKSSGIAAGFLSMALCYVGGLFGGFSAACYTAVTKPTPREPVVFELRHDYVPVSSYTLIDDLSDEASSTNSLNRAAGNNVPASPESTHSDLPFGSMQATREVLQTIPRLKTLLHRWNSYWNNEQEQPASQQEMQAFDLSYKQYEDEDEPDDDILLFGTPPETPPKKSPEL